MKLFIYYVKIALMKKIIFLFLLTIVAWCGCGPQVRFFGPKPAEQTQMVPMIGTLSDQQLAAYPQLDENPYLVLKDFESPGQLDDFSLTRSGGPLETSKIFYSGSPTATGTGALGVAFGPEGEYSLAFSTPVRRWKEYNLFLLSLFVNEDQVFCGLKISDAEGKMYKTSFLLRKSWNKLQVDLKSVGKSIDLSRVDKLIFSFNRIGDTKIYLDDLILVDYHKVLLGQVDGPPGTLFAFQNGKEIHLGSNRRFELVFSEGKMIGWYDLETDLGRINNLLGPSNPGLEIFQVADNNRLGRIPSDHELVNAHTSLAVKEDKQIALTVENYFGDVPGDRPNQTFKYYIYPDGLILLEIMAGSKTGRLGIGLSVDPNQGFEAVVGKLRNPFGASQSRIEYCLFRRMGKRAGADLILMAKPWKADGLPVQCRLNGRKAVLISDANMGENFIRGMIRLWPTNIDHIGNAEIHVRKFMETPGPEIKSQPGSPQGWQPAWKMK